MKAEKPQDKEWLKKIVPDVLYLAVCALHDQVPDLGRVQRMDLQTVYHMSRFHNLTAISCMAVEKAVSNINLSEKEKQLLHKWQEGKNKAIRKNLLLDSARGELEAWMEKEKIWHMPLKGVILKDMYPKAGMRQMADNDILFDASYQQEVKEYFVSQGYQVEIYKKGNHDVYQKPPVLNFEMHTSLYGGTHREALKKYYENVRERLLENPDKKFQLYFTPEDFYVYFISHACGHHERGGTGLRTILDIYVYLERYKEKMDWDYIKKQLNILSLTKYEAILRNVSLKINAVSNDTRKVSLTLEEKELLGYMSGSGTYGTRKNRYMNRLKQLKSEDDNKFSVKIKLKYYWKRLVPDMEFYQRNYPFLYRHRWLIPAGLFIRAVKGILLRPKTFWQEVKTVWKISE